MFYKNECGIMSLEDMNEGATQKWCIETGSFINISWRHFTTLNFIKHFLSV